MDLGVEGSVCSDGVAFEARDMLHGVLSVLKAVHLFSFGNSVFEAYADHTVCIGYLGYPHNSSTPMNPY